MPVERHRISHSQLAELLGHSPATFVSIDRVCSREYSGWEVVTEGDDMAQTSGTLPQLSDNIRRKPRGKGKKGC